MAFNPFYNFTLEACEAGIAEIQERLLVGAKKVSHAGSGGMDMFEAETDIQNLQHLSNRRADLLGEPRPSRTRIRAFTVNAVGYRHAER